MTRAPRAFHLEVVPNGTDRYALDLVADGDGHAPRVVHLSAGDVERLRPAVVGAVTSSRHPRTVLSPTRMAPIALSEDAGVRLSLQALGTAPISKPVRAEAIRVGVDAMTSEEALYWYAKVTGLHASRSLRALRLLLADDQGTQ